MSAIQRAKMTAKALGAPRVVGYAFLTTVAVSSAVSTGVQVAGYRQQTRAAYPSQAMLAATPTPARLFEFSNKIRVLHDGKQVVIVPHAGVVPELYGPTTFELAPGQSISLRNYLSMYNWESYGATWGLFVSSEPGVTVTNENVDTNTLTLNPAAYTSEELGPGITLTNPGEKKASVTVMIGFHPIATAGGET